MKCGKDFLETRDKLDELNHYKKLHALLHKLHFEVYNLLVIEVIGPSRERVDWAVLGNHAISLVQIVPELSDSSIFGLDRIGWLPDARNELLRAIMEKDFDRLEKARSGLERVVTSWPSRLVTKLKDAAEQLRLDRLLTDLSELHDRAAGADLSKEKVALVGNDVRTLSNQLQHLKLLIENHDLLQKIDTMVRVISRNHSARDPGDLTDAWPWLNESMIGLRFDEKDKRAESFRQSWEKVTDAIESGDRSRVPGTFWDFRGALDRYFLYVDEALKESCGEVQKIGKPLTEIAEMLG
ncbi:MAG: hypothetical protein ACHRXM_24485 [Isosphaerales bacterium]